MGWPVTAANPQITLPNGQQASLLFTQTIPGAFGLALCYRSDSTGEWLGDLLDPNFDMSILGDSAKWNAWLASMAARFQIEVPKVIKVQQPIASDAVPKTLDEVSAWINQHTGFVIDQTTGLPIIVGK